MFVVSVLEMFSIGMIVPVIQAITTNEQSIDAKMLVDWLPMGRIDTERLILIFIGLFVFKNIAIFWTSYAVSRTVLSSGARFLTELYVLYLARPLPFHHRHNSAELLRNLTSGTWQTFQGVNVILSIGLEILLVTAILATLLLVAPWITLGTAAALGILGGLVYKFASPVLVHWGAVSMTAEGQVLKWLNQSFAALRDVKLTRSYKYLADIVEQIALQQALYNARASTVLQSPRLLVEIVAVVSGMVIATIIADTSDNRQDATVILGLLGLAAMRMMPSLNRILIGVADLRFRTKYIDTLYDDLNSGKIHTDLQGEEGPTHPDIKLESTISLRDVTFRYDEAADDALRDISLTIKSGQSIGIVGPSGTGKSTLVDLILGLLSPGSGEILVDGRPLSNNIGSWQRNIGYVPQQIALFDDTLRRNIAFGIPDGLINESRVREVVKLAKLEDVVANLPGGLNTVIGERGVRLSGGQRQRIAIARALYRDPDLLIFDEATAALDNETESEITDAINTFAGEKTLVIIAHRLSTVAKCDCIVYMARGQIVAVGQMEELLRTNAEFRKFVRSGTTNLESVQPVASES